MRASGPAARAPRPSPQFGHSYPDAPFSRLFLLGGGHPADPLVPSKRGDVHPGGERLRVGAEGFFYVLGKLVDGAGRERGHGRSIVEIQEYKKMESSASYSLRDSL